MFLVRQSNTATIVFFMVDSSDHVTPKTGLSPTVVISKNGGSFAAGGGTVAEIGNGFYRYNATATDTNTLGALAFHCTATGADPTSFVVQVVAFNPYDNYAMGMLYLDTYITSRATAQSVWEYTSRTLTSFGTLVSDIWSYSSRTLTSFGTLVSDIWSHSTRTLTAFSTSLAVAVWDVLESAIGTANSIGVKVKNNLDAAVSTRATAQSVWEYTTRTLTSFGTLVSDIWNHATRTLTGFSTSLAVSVWDVLESAIGTANSIGLKVKNNLNAAVSSRATDASVWSYSTRTLTSIGSEVVDQIVDGVWDEPISGHLTSGSTGAALNAAGSAGDPWSTPLPGAYGSGTAGWILGNRLDTAVSSRADGADYTAVRAAKLDNLDTTVSSRATPQSVWEYTTRTLTSFGTLVSDIWSYSTRTLTSFGTLVSDIWGYSTRTLTSFGTLVADIWSHSTRTLSSFGSLVSDIWGHTTSVGVSALTLVERSYRVLANKLKINGSTGDVTLYADNDTGTAATGTITEASGEVTRSKLTWS